MFDEYTTSNAESEHASLKKKSLGVNANASMTTLAKKTHMNSTQKSNKRSVYQSNDIDTINTTTKCQLSQYIVKHCFLKLKDRVNLAKKCISKQVSQKKWIVCYKRNGVIKKDLHLHYLPVFQRLRTVILDNNNFLKCSCKTIQRHGYPCHHLLHVLKCFNTPEIKKEWIHIRWTKDYAMKHFQNDTSKKMMNIYKSLYDNYPPGPYFVGESTNSYPNYYSYNNKTNIHNMFPSTPFYFLSKTTNLEWVNTFKSNNPELKQLLQNNDSSFLTTVISLSQQEQEYHNSLESEDKVSIDIDDYDDTDVTNINHPIFTDKYSMFKRAQDLCGNDVEKHKELYNMLSNFVLTNEINHNDNRRILNKRKNKGIVTISSNKIVNTRKRSTKRMKSCHEK